MGGGRGVGCVWGGVCDVELGGVGCCGCGGLVVG
jgi:hypothetical protein